MSIINAKKESNLTEINCDDSLKATHLISTKSDLHTNPVDIVLLVDRACSLAGTPLSLLKESLYRFIDQIDTASNDSACGTIGNESRIGLVSFAGEAQINLPLSNSVETLKKEIATLTTGCNSNHSAAFSTAAGLFDSESQNRKCIVLFTASHNTIGADPEIAATDIKEKEIMIYGIGVTSLGGLETERLKTWVSQPSDTHAFLTDTLTDLNDLFSKVVERIVGSKTPTAINEEPCNCFDPSVTPITLEVKAGSWREYLLYSTQEKAHNNSIALNVIVQNLKPTRELRLRVTLIEVKNSCIEEERDTQRFVLYPNTRTYTFYSIDALIRDFHFNLPTTENQLKIRLSAKYID